MLSKEQKYQQQHKTFVMFSVDNGKLIVSRWTGDVLPDVLQKKFPQLFASDSLDQFFLNAPVGSNISFALCFNFAFMRES